MNTLENAVQWIRDNQAPFWTLLKKETWEKDYTRIYQYGENPSASDMVEDAIQELGIKVNNYRNPGVKFQLFTATNKSTSGDKRLGPFNFENVAAPAQGTMGSAGLGGLGNLDLFSHALGQLTSIGNAKSQMESNYYEKLNALQIRENQLIVEKTVFENEKKRFEEDKQKFLRTLRNLKKKYQDRSEQVKEGTFLAVEKALEHFLKPGTSDRVLNGLSGTPASQPMGGASATIAETTTTETETETPEEKLVNEIANNIMDKVSDLEDLKVVGMLVDQILNSPETIAKYRAALQNKQANVQAQTEPNPDDTPDE